MRRDESRLNDAISDAVELDRRTVNRAMAWSVPVVMAAVAAPAATGSSSVSITSVAATYVPAAGSAKAKVSLALVVRSAGAGNTITFTSLAQGAKSFNFVGSTSFPLRAGDNTITIETETVGAVSPRSSILSYTSNLGAGTTAVAIAPVTVATAATRSGNGSAQTFTLALSPRNPNSHLVVTSVTSAANKKGDPAGSWTAISQTEWADVGTAAVTFTAKPPSGSFAPAATVAGTIDEIPFSVTSN